MRTTRFLLPLAAAALLHASAGRSSAFPAVEDQAARTPAFGTAALLGAGLLLAAFLAALVAGRFRETRP